MIKDTLDD